jgi:hypothetical protein
MVALKEEYTTDMAFEAGEHMLATVSLRPVRQTVWRRKHEIRAGGAPHFYTGAMTPELPPDNEVRVGYRNRVDDPEGRGYEYVGFAYRGCLRFDDLPQVPDAVVVDAHLILRIDETLWQVGGNPAGKLVSAASRLLVLEAPLQTGDAAFFTPAYTYCELPNEVGVLGKAAFSLKEGLKIDVAALVQAWMRGEVRNYGLMLMGSSEAFEHNNDVRESTYSETLLSVSYTLKN